MAGMSELGQQTPTMRPVDVWSARNSSSTSAKLGTRKPAGPAPGGA
jgi:hypothetical protein